MLDLDFGNTYYILVPLVTTPITTTTITLGTWTSLLKFRYQGSGIILVSKRDTSAYNQASLYASPSSDIHTYILLVYFITSETNSRM